MLEFHADDIIQQWFTNLFFLFSVNEKDSIYKIQKLHKMIVETIANRIYINIQLAFY